MNVCNVELKWKKVCSVMRRRLKNCTYFAENPSAATSNQLVEPDAHAKVYNLCLVMVTGGFSVGSSALNR